VNRNGGGVNGADLNIGMTETIVTPNTDLYGEAVAAHEQSKAAIQSAILMLESDDELIGSVCRVLSESLQAKSWWNEAWQDLESRHNDDRTSL